MRLEHNAHFWFHQPTSPMLDRQVQSSKARELLRHALDAVGISVTERQLAMKGLSLIRLIHDQLGVRISIAHCPTMLVLGIARHKVGVDCEAPGKSRNWLGIAEQFFTAGEAKAIAGLDPKQQEAVFLQYWTLKEAYLKANEGNLFGDLNRLTVDSGADTSTILEDGGRWQAWNTVIDRCNVSICLQQQAIVAPDIFNCSDLIHGGYTACLNSVPLTLVSACRFR